jgi:O-acetylhomoserine/O-acetylserine sulfhydrylase-like pyridoxal-dependent enzyme
MVDDFLNNASKKPFAVYLTSPDYLGNIADIQGIAQICKKHGVLLLVDNAHGAYLKFSNSLLQL